MSFTQFDRVTDEMAGGAGTDHELQNLVREIRRLGTEFFTFRPGNDFSVEEVRACMPACL